MKDAVRTAAAPAAKGPYSQGIVTSGRMLYVSGQGPVEPASGEFLTSTFDEQLRLTLRNVQAIAEAAGGSLSDAVKVNVYLSDMGNFQQMNRIYQEFFSEPRPARTTVQSTLPGFDVEVDAIIALQG